MTANAICSLSLDPLLALVCFENRARTLPIVREAGRFAVNMLSASQEHLARRVRLEAAGGGEARGRRAPDRAGHADHRRRARLGRLRAARADRRRRPHDRDRRGASRWASATASRCCGTPGATTRAATDRPGDCVAGCGPATAARAEQASLPSALAAACRCTRRSRAARASSTHDHERRERHHPELALDDRRHDRLLLVLGQLADLVRGLEPARVEHHLRRGDPQLLGDEARRRAAAGRRSRGAQVACGPISTSTPPSAACSTTTTWPARSTRQNQSLCRARHQHQAPQQTGDALSTIASTPTTMWTSFTHATPQVVLGRRQRVRGDSAVATSEHSRISH